MGGTLQYTAPAFRDWQHKRQLFSSVLLLENEQVNKSLCVMYEEWIDKVTPREKPKIPHIPRDSHLKIHKQGSNYNFLINRPYSFPNIFPETLLQLLKWSKKAKLDRSLSISRLLSSIWRWSSDWLGHWFFRRDPSDEGAALEKWFMIYDSM